MKLLLVAVVLSIFLALGEAKRCSLAEDCEEGECCLAHSIFGFLAKCQKLAQNGERCSDKDTISFRGDKYLRHCPCSVGLSCEPREIKNIPFVGTMKIDERCVEDVSHTTPAEPETKEPEPETEEPEPETE